MQYAGCSAVYGPLGETLLDLGSKECSGIVTISLDKVAEVRSLLPFLQDADTFSLG